MTEPTAVEQELVKVSKFKGAKYKDRQDYLAALVRALEKMPQDDIDNLSDPAYDWWKVAVASMDNKEEVPDFDDDEEGESDEQPDGNETEGADSEETADHELEEALQDDASGATAASPATEVETAIEPEPVDPAGTEPEEAPKKAKGKKAKKAKATPYNERDPTPTRYDNLTGNKNRYGVYEGTKKDDAIKMFEKGASMAEVKDVVGDSKYNLIRDLQKAGHRVEKHGSKFVLIHKDDVTKK